MKVEKMLKVFIKLNEAGIMVCPPYIFFVGKRNRTYFVIDIHVIRNHIGGNGNGIIIEFSNAKSCITWITKRLVLSGVKASAPQDIFEISFSPEENDSVLQDEDSENTEQEQGNERSHSGNVQSSWKEDEKLDPSEWLKLENKYWGQYRLPYLSEIKRKLTNSETYAIIKSEVKVCERVPQACRENSIFVISSNCLKNVEDIKSDLNGVSRTCHKAKSKRVQVNNIIVTVKQNSNKEIVEVELVMKINRRENEYGLVRNITWKMEATIPIY